MRKRKKFKKCLRRNSKKKTIFLTPNFFVFVSVRFFFLCKSISPLFNIIPKNGRIAFIYLFYIYIFLYAQNFEFLHVLITRSFYQFFFHLKKVFRSNCFFFLIYSSIHLMLLYIAKFTIFFILFVSYFIKKII